MCGGRPFSFFLFFLNVFREWTVPFIHSRGFTSARIWFYLRRKKKEKKTRSRNNNWWKMHPCMCDLSRSKRKRTRVFAVIWRANSFLKNADHQVQNVVYHCDIIGRWIKITTSKLNGKLTHNLSGFVGLVVTVLILPHCVFWTLTVVHFSKFRYRGR